MELPKAQEGPGRDRKLKKGIVTMTSKLIKRTTCPPPFRRRGLSPSLVFISEKEILKILMKNPLRKKLVKMKPRVRKAPNGYN